MAEPRPTVTQFEGGWQVRYWYGRPWQPPQCDHMHRTRAAAIRCYLRLHRKAVATVLEADDDWWTENGGDS